MIAVHDDVEATGGDGVDDGQAGRPGIEHRLGVALHRMLGQRVALDVLDREALGPDRPEGRPDDIARQRPVVLGRVGDGRRGSRRGRVPAHGRGVVDRGEDVWRAVAERRWRLVAEITGQVAPDVASAFVRVTLHTFLLVWSSAGPGRRALFHERAHPFALVLGGEELEEGRPFGAKTR